MNAFLAIMSDTWLQSRRQIVFIVLIVLMLLAAVVFVAVPTVGTDDSGDETFAILWYEPITLFDEVWVNIYATSLMAESGQMLSPFSKEGREHERELSRKRQEARAQSQHISHIQRSTESWAFFALIAFFMISMTLFIGASASYFPNMLDAGAIDVTLSKPLTRGYVFMAKFCGGLALFTVVVALTYAILVVGLGIRTGHWPTRVFLALPIQVFSAAVLFSMVAALGVLWRGTAISMIVAYVFYIVVDKLVAAVGAAQQLGVLQWEGWEWVDTAVQWVVFLLPSFEYLKQTTSVVCLNMPVIEWSRIVVAAAWMGLALLLGYWRFRRADYS